MMNENEVFHWNPEKRITEFARNLHQPSIKAAEVLRLTGLSNSRLQNWVREGGFFASLESPNGRKRRFTPFMLMALDIRAKLPLAPEQAGRALETASDIAKAVEPLLKKCERPEALKEACTILSGVALSGTWNAPTGRFVFKLHRLNKERLPDIKKMLIACDEPLSLWLIGRRVLEVANEARLVED